MAGRYEVDESAVSSAPPAAVWALLADVTTWSEWGPWDEAAREREGDPPPDGVGARRRVRRGRVVSIEEVTAFEPPFRLGYRLVERGLPVKGYEAEVTLVGEGDGTRIRWRSSFDGRYPLVGAVLRPALARFTRDVAGRVARAAEAAILG
jgi:hypothetical protein